MKTKEIKTDIVTLTPQLAHELLSANNNNRKLRTREVERYARDILAGNWKFTGEAIKVDWNGNLIDGQHRSNAVIMANKPIQVLLITGLNPETQSVIDVAVKRTAIDALRWAGFSGDLTILSKIARVDTLWRSGFRFTSSTTHGSYPALSHSEIVDWVSNNPEAFVSARFGQSHYASIGFTPSIMAFAHMLMREVDEIACDVFWQELIEMRTSGLGDPRLTMTRIIQARRAEGVKLSDGVQLYYMMRAWNAWRGGLSLTKMPVVSNSKPIEIPQPE